MHATGIRRKVDDLGRIVIPAGIRHSLDIGEGDPLDVSVDGDKVVLMKPVDRCVFCGGDAELGTFRAKMVCRPCVVALGVPDAPSGADAGADAEARGQAPGPTATIGPQGIDPRTSPPDERAAGVRDERRAPYDPASSTAW